MFFWSIYWYQFRRFWDLEIYKVYELWNQWSKLWVFGPHKYCPFIFDCFLGVVGDFAGVLVAHVVLANFEGQWKLLIVPEVRAHYLLNLSLIFQRELFLDNTLEILVDIQMVVLIFEIRWYMLSTNRAHGLIAQVAPHALDAESVTTWKEARFHHEVEAYCAFCLHLLLLFVVQSFEDVFHETLKSTKILLHLLFWVLLHDVGLIQRVLNFLFLDVSVFVWLHGLRLTLLVEKYDLIFGPISISFTEIPPFFQNLSLSELLIFRFKICSLPVSLYLIDDSRALFFYSFLVELVKLFSSFVEVGSSLILVDLCLFSVKRSDEFAI